MLTDFLALACRHSQRGHALKLGLLQPLLHAPERLAPALELRPGLGVPQQVGEGSLGAAKYSLSKDCLRD